ncbi:MAG: hypothetical protein COT89_03195 [Candidatus Colwellbacteria bacterium CG10_big_fil_rev_8_21_14_0_10_42_22]|uniref:DUF5671 domain-containing protein n=1 Tax=Candidatus Colwellbacteria bacterium CG10_big_fil_rev_8_21_14_0_10_42_22 TaxID=1974540 RepID=A0A2H0VF77_9BACT|nr:MAG: hypothetical protein COT89_03195 [Candidatus Colwellbacteria bacterium CG10_big_fil_rev_8_21_14_0_10_42_22]
MEEAVEHQPKLSPKFFFTSLFILVWLITTVTSFLNVVFGVLNKKFPDVLNADYQYGYNPYELSAMRSALATLLVIFPVFILASYFWTKMLKGRLGRVDLVIKKWMLYLIVFLATITIVVDLITLVRYFVEGEITTRFLLKVAATLVTALVVGLYYLYELKNTEKRKAVRILCLTLAVVFVTSAVIGAFMIIGSPMEQRALRLDQRRIEDLQNIQWQIVSYWQNKEVLPKTLNDLKDPLQGYSLPVDPEFEKGRTYEYNALKPLTFELCATFTKPMPEGWVEYYRGGGIVPMGGKGGYIEDMAISYPWPGGTNDSWDHEEGRACFERTIDPEVYRPYGVD